MDLLTRIKGPRDLDRLSLGELDRLADEIRTFLVDAVSKTGGHLGPNLGVVELTIALHRVFESPRDKVLWDTGHQSYVHKLLTGRQDFSRLKSKGGLSGYPSRAESDHDVIENSHASGVLGWADGLAKANEVLKKDDHVVAVIGDGALTGGMAWEALNNIAAAKDRPSSSSSTTTSAPTPRPSAAWPTTSPRSVRPTVTNGSWPAARTSWSARPSSAARSTRPCTAPRRASRTSSPRRACSRTSA